MDVLKDQSAAALRPYIFPEGFVYRLADVRGADQERAQGLLTLRVVEAVNVPRMDLFSAGDPYVRYGLADLSPLFDFLWYSPVARPGISILLLCVGQWEVGYLVPFCCRSCEGSKGVLPPAWPC